MLIFAAVLFIKAKTWIWKQLRCLLLMDEWTNEWMNGWINIDDNLAVKKEILSFGPGEYYTEWNNYERKTNIVWSYLYVQFSFFSFIWNPNTEAINITKLVLMIIKAWIFWVCWLSPTWYNGDCSQLMSQFDCYQLQLFYLTVEHHPVKHFQHETSQTTFNMFGHSENLLHTLQKSFFVF